MKILALQSLTDNYIWILEKKDSIIAVDPGTAEPVLAYLANCQSQLSAILLTHHHHDHTGGVRTLQTHFPSATTYGPRIPDLHVDHVVSTQHAVMVDHVPWQILHTPGHTLDHICFYHDHHLFCGDTLFSAGCGRVFEGTSQQLFAGLEKIKTLPDDTFLYPAHEYTLDNLKFAQHIEPHNTALATHVQHVRSVRRRDRPSVPTTLLQEKNINPFLRCHQHEIQERVAMLSKKSCTTPLSTFTAMRALKDQFSC